MAAWHIILNEHAGASGIARPLCDRLSSRLSESQIQFDIYETKYPGHAGEIGRAIVAGSGATTIAIIGGDGTLHELINGIMGQRETQIGQSDETNRVNIVLLPSGTANALYHSLFPSTCTSTEFDRFLSVESALSASQDQLRPLSLLDVSKGNLSTTEHLYYSHVVTSTCLHAQLLETASSPEWRKLYPGTERFRKAAEKHIGTSYPTRFSLFPRSGGAGVQKWSQASQTWETIAENGFEIRGDLTYFVSSLVDRFEATFRITPHSAPDKDRPADAVDILLVRARSGDKAVEAERLMQVLMAAYSEDGKHLQIQEEMDGKSSYVVEYYRAQGFDWQPVRSISCDLCPDERKKSDLISFSPCAGRRECRVYLCGRDYLPLEQRRHPHLLSSLAPVCFY